MKKLLVLALAFALSPIAHLGAANIWYFDADKTTNDQFGGTPPTTSIGWGAWGEGAAAYSFWQNDAGERYTTNNDSIGTIFANATLVFKGEEGTMKIGAGNSYTPALAGLTIETNFTISTSDLVYQRYLKGNGTAFNINIAAGKVLNMDNVSIRNAFSNSSNPSILVTGGGHLFLGDNATLSANHSNGRVSVGAATGGFTTLTMQSGSVISGNRVNRDPLVATNYNRFAVDNGIANILTGAELHAASLREANLGPRTTGTIAGIFIGSLTYASTGNGSILNISGGNVVALGSTNMTASAPTTMDLGLGVGVGAGLTFGSTLANSAGGTVNINNAGTLTTTNIVASDKLHASAKSVLTFDNANLIVSEQTGQDQLNSFISGFQNTANSYVEIKAGGLTLNTGNIAAVGTTPIYNPATNAVTERTAVISSAIRGAGGLTKTGTGAVRLTANNTYTGDTLVNQGTLINDGSLTSNVTVAIGASVSGNGTFANIDILDTDATFDTTGFSAANLHFAQNLTINLDLTNATDSTFSFITLESLTAGGSTLTLNLIGTSSSDLAAYNLLSYGTTTLDPNTEILVTGDLNGLSYSLQNGQLVLGIPEPSTYALIAALGILTLALARRRK